MSFQTFVCVAGQHRRMPDQALGMSDVAPDFDLDIMKEKQTQFDIETDVLSNICRVLQKAAPDIVLMHGDTSINFAIARVCFYQQIPVGHVEVGLRVSNVASPYPKGFNRQAVGIMAKYHFALTQFSHNNLSPLVRNTAYEERGGDDGVHIMEPLDALDFHDFVAWCYLILADTCGTQEEVLALGKLCWLS